MTDTTGRRFFFLQAEDRETGSVILETRLPVADLAALRDLLGAAAEDDAHLKGSYSLDAVQLRAVAALSASPFAPDVRFNLLAPWHPLRECPYLNHTGYELPLMLEDRKPLAVFQDAYPLDSFDHSMARFDPFVASGRFVRRIIDEPWSAPRRIASGAICAGIRKVYVALPGHEWRIDAYLQIEEAAARSGWNEINERMQGTLLGYEDWQNDWWIAYQRAVFSSSGA